MVCYTPLKAHRSAKGVSFSWKESSFGAPIDLPCGQCRGCRRRRAAEWAARCMHESQMHKDSCFLTLTFDDEKLPPQRPGMPPPNVGLDKKLVQDFMKRVRSRLGRKVRFYACGEYGENFGRPHYHMILFGYDFIDKKLISNKGGNALYQSALLDDLWPFGYAAIGSVTFESAAYVASYCMKKYTGKAAKKYYEFLDLTTGEVFDLQPEFSLMSLKPGIGAAWLDKYKAEVYPSDSVVVSGRELRPPRYYDKSFDVDSVEYREIKEKRFLNAKKCFDKRGEDGLIIKSIVDEAKSLMYKREVE